MSDKTPDHVQSLFDEISDARAAGKVMTHFWPLSAPLSPLPKALNALMPAAGLGSGGEAWREIPRIQASSGLLNLLTRDMAYQAECADEEVAAPLVERFMGLFQDPARFFTNGDLLFSTGSAGWHPLTSSTFDAGVVAVTDSAAGVVWFEDED